MSHMLARERAASWGGQPRPPAAGLDGEDCRGCPPGIDGPSVGVWGRNMDVAWEEFTLALGEGLGEGEAGLALASVYSL